MGGNSSAYEKRVSPSDMAAPSDRAMAIMNGRRAASDCAPVGKEGDELKSLFIFIFSRNDC